jgi:hypothetical protein
MEYLQHVGFFIGKQKIEAREFTIYSKEMWMLPMSFLKEQEERNFL